MKAPYHELGLVNTKEVFKKAMEGGYAVPAYNFNNMEQLQAIVLGCAESKSPVILHVSKGARDYANQTLLRYMAMGAVQMAKEMGSNISRQQEARKARGAMLFQEYKKKMGMVQAEVAATATPPAAQPERQALPRRV